MKKKQQLHKSHAILPPAITIENDPAIITKLIANSQASIELLKQNIQAKSGVRAF